MMHRMKWTDRKRHVLDQLKWLAFIIASVALVLGFLIYEGRIVL